MPIKSCSLKIDLHQYETDNRGTPMFPCGAYITTVGDTITRHIPWHWHEEIEVLLVCSGTLKIEIPGQCFDVREGEGVFINSSILQTAVNVGDCSCEVKSFVFNPSIISGALESTFEQRYVRPLLDCSKLPGIHLGKTVEWHRNAVQCIFDAFEYYQDESFGYELLVRNKLSHLWFLIVSNNQEVLVEQKASKDLDTLRVKDMLEFIHAHYAEQIQVQNIAKAAAISERECQRCFKKTIGITPMKYLLKHRISVAAGLLANSNITVTEICKFSGFDSPSYFSLMFKKFVEVTPREYRSSANVNLDEESYNGVSKERGGEKWKKGQSYQTL